MKVSQSGRPRFSFLAMVIGEGFEAFFGCLGKEWVVSAEKWQGRYKARFRQVIGLMLRYRWVRRKGVEAAAEFSGILYQEYYRKKHRR